MGSFSVSDTGPWKLRPKLPGNYFTRTIRPNFLRRKMTDPFLRIAYFTSRRPLGHRSRKFAGVPMERFGVSRKLDTVPILVPVSMGFLSQVRMSSVSFLGWGPTGMWFASLCRKKMSRNLISLGIRSGIRQRELGETQAPALLIIWTGWIRPQ
jgi:hypothetical protein